MNQDSEIQNELQKISPLVAKANKVEAFDVDDSYFKKLKGETLTRIEVLKEDSSKMHFWNRTKITLLAACIVGLISIGLFFYKNNSPSIDTQQNAFANNLNIDNILDSIPNDDLKKYVSQNHDEQELYALAMDKNIDVQDILMDTTPTLNHEAKKDTLKPKMKQMDIDLELDKLLNEIDNLDQFENDLLITSPNSEI